MHWYRVIDDKCEEKVENLELYIVIDNRFKAPSQAKYNSFLAAYQHHHPNFT